MFEDALQTFAQQLHEFVDPTASTAGRRGRCALGRCFTTYTPRDSVPVPPPVLFGLRDRQFVQAILERDGSLRMAK